MDLMNAARNRAISPLGPEDPGPPRQARAQEASGGLARDARDNLKALERAPDITETPAIAALALAATTRAHGLLTVVVVETAARARALHASLTRLLGRDHG